MTAEEMTIEASMESALPKLRSATATMGGVSEAERELLRRFLDSELGERQRRRECKAPPQSTLFPGCR